VRWQIRPGWIESVTRKAREKGERGEGERESDKSEKERER